MVSELCTQTTRTCTA